MVEPIVLYLIGLRLVIVLLIVNQMNIGVTVLISRTIVAGKNVRNVFALNISIASVYQDRNPRHEVIIQPGNRKLHADIR